MKVEIILTNSFFILLPSSFQSLLRRLLQLSHALLE